MSIYLYLHQSYSRRFLRAGTQAVNSDKKQSNETDLFLVGMTQHLYTLQINDALEALLGLLRLLLAVAAVLADAEQTAEQDQSSDDSDADQSPEWN